MVDKVPGDTCTKLAFQIPASAGMTQFIFSFKEKFHLLPEVARASKSKL